MMISVAPTVFICCCVLTIFLALLLKYVQGLVFSFIKTSDEDDSVVDVPIITFEDLRRRTRQGSVHNLCFLCISEFNNQDEVSRLSRCGHVFHTSCIESHLRCNLFTCPFCRSSLFGIDLVSRGATKNLETGGHLSMDTNDDEEIPKLTIASFHAREEEIEKKKMEVKEKVEFKLGRAEQETRRLAQVWEELQVLTDPMGKEVAVVRRKIDVVNRELKSLGQNCQKKEKEYKEALEAFKEKNSEKNQLTTTLVEMVNGSEKLRLKKLEELSNIIDPKR